MILSNYSHKRVTFIFEQSLNKKKKEKVINELIAQLNISDGRANEIYDVIMEFVSSKIKEKIKHAFKSYD